MIGMIVMILAEVILRGAFNSSTEYSDELVGYLLVGVSFFSLALCQGRARSTGSRWCSRGSGQAARRSRR